MIATETRPKDPNWLTQGRERTLQRAEPPGKHASQTNRSSEGYALSSSVLELVPAGVDTVAHRHDSELFGYVLEGAVDVQLEGGPMQRFEAEQMFYEQRNVLHAYLGNPNQPARVLILNIVKDGRSTYRPERAGSE
jgi:quercetin dioxygenase-like cupin family protein